MISSVSQIPSQTWVSDHLIGCRLQPSYGSRQPLPHSDVALADGLHLPYRSGEPASVVHEGRCPRTSASHHQVSDWARIGSGSTP